LTVGTNSGSTQDVPWRSTVIGVLIATIVVLVPLAHADPPDPSWPGGLWDGADYDDVVVLATTVVGATEGGPPYDARLAEVVASDAFEPAELARSACSLLSDLTRAPPAS